MNNRQEQITALQKEIQRLENEETKEIQSGILPLLRTGNFIFIFRDLCNLGVISGNGNEDDISKLIKLMAGKVGGFYHFGCPISENSTVDFDDNDVSIRFKFNWNKSKLEQSRQKFIEEIKKLGIKVNFNNEKSELTSYIKRYQQELKNVEDLERSLYEPQTI